MRARASRLGVDMRASVSRWWRGELGRSGAFLQRVLAPAELAYRVVVRARNAGYDAGWLRTDSAEIPVVSVGNLAVGGAGKTPLAAWIARSLAAAGRHPAVVLRGYAQDEVLLHRELSPGIPVFVAPRRSEGVRAASRAGRDCAVLDDGFQHRSLARNLDIVLVGAESWGERRHLLPRGPWREGIMALGRADFVLVTRKTASRAEAELVADHLQPFASPAPIGICRLAPLHLELLRTDDTDAMPIHMLAGRDVLAVSALADPRPFLAHLRHAGARIESAAYPDHHDFTPRDAARLAERAAGRPLVMTRKEAVKLRPLLPAEPPAFVLDQAVEIEKGEETLASALHDATGRAVG